MNPMSELMRQWVYHVMFAHHYKAGDGLVRRPSPDCAVCGAFAVLCEADRTIAQEQHD